MTMPVNAVRPLTKTSVRRATRETDARMSACLHLWCAHFQVVRTAPRSAMRCAHKTRCVYNCTTTICLCIWCIGCRIVVHKALFVFARAMYTTSTRLWAFLHDPPHFVLARFVGALFLWGCIMNAQQRSHMFKFRSVPRTETAAFANWFSGCVTPAGLRAI